MGFQLCLLGPFAIVLDGEDQATNKLNRKTRAILAYLAAAGTAQPRRLLAEMFCQDTNDPAGTLRWHLSQIRRRLDPQLVLTDRKIARINFDIAAVDSYAFAHHLSNPEKQSLAMLQQQIGQYRGDFLADLELPDSPEYELWLLGERARFEMLYENGALVLAGRLIQKKAYAEAKRLAVQLLNRNPLQEQLHRYLIWLYAQEGAIEAATGQYEICARLLWRELAVEPAPATVALHQALVSQAPLPALTIPLTAVSDEWASAWSSSQTMTPFIGRTAEMALLRHEWATTAKGAGAIILVDGLAGGGKSRLINQFAYEALSKRDFKQGRCFESTNALPYLPWLAILEPIAATLSPSQRAQIPEHWQGQLKRLLPDHFPEATSVPEQQDFLFRAVVALLEVAAAATAQAIHIDDLQWADATSLGLFCFLAAEVARLQLPLLLIGSYRREESPANAALQTALRDLSGLKSTLRLSLEPLTEAEAAALVAETAKEQAFDNVDLGGRSWLAETGGNPLFIVEIVQTLLERDEPTATLPIPPSLQQLTEQRLSQLTPDSRQVLETLAILDRPPSFDLLQQVSGRSEAETMTALETGLQWRFLTPQGDDLFRFSHDLIAGAIREQLSEIRRQRLHHRAAANLIRLHGDDGAIAYHWRLAGNRDQELIYTIRAGQAALNQSAYADAEALFERARTIVPPTALAQQFAISLGLARALQITKGGEDWEKAIAALMTLSEQTQRPDFRIDAALLHIENLQHKGDNEAALAVAEEHLPIALASRLQRRRAQLLLKVGNIYRDLGQYETAVTYAEQAQLLFQQFEDRTGLAQVTTTLAVLNQFVGQSRQAITLFKEALNYYQAIGDPYNEGQTLAYLSDALYSLDMSGEGRPYLDAGLQISRQLGDEMGSARQLNGLGGTLLNKGDYRGAIDHYRQALAIVERHQHTLATAVCLNNIAAALNAIGENESAYEHAGRSLALTRAAHFPRWEAFALKTMALAAFNLGNLLEAKELLLAAYQIRVELGETPLTLITSANLVLFCARLNELAEAETFLAISQELIEQLADNVPTYTLIRLQYAAYHLRQAQGDQKAAHQHIFHAHDLLTAQMANPQSSSSELKFQSSDYQEIREIVMALKAK